MTRIDNDRQIRAPRGTTLTAKSWLTEAPLRMLMNNLDPDVAEKPGELVVYGGVGRAARDWQSFDRIVAALRSLEADQTLLVQSGKPVGIFRTHADAPLHVHDGWLASDALPLDAFLGTALVIDVSDAPAGPLTIDADDPRLLGAERLLLKTGRCIADGGFPAEWPVLDPGTAASLAARGLRLVGVDSPSVDARHSTQLEVHHALFAGGAGFPVVDDAFGQVVHL